MSKTIQTKPGHPAPLTRTEEGITSHPALLARPEDGAPASIPPVQESAAKAPVVKSRSLTWYIRQGLKGLASLRLTVFLFVLSLLLVFFGTLAQIDAGIWTVVNSYFRWFWVWVPFQLFFEFGQVFFWFPKTMTVGGSFPFPGGLTLGVLLLVNLLAAHAIRFKLSWKRSGILLIHFGLILMVLGEFIAYFAIEGEMAIEEGQTSNQVRHTRLYELAIIRPDDNEKDRDHVTVVPARLLKKTGSTITNDQLPFDIHVVKWLVNADLHIPAKGENNQADKGFGTERIAVERGEVSGVDSKQTVEMPACYLEVLKKNGTSLGTYLMSIKLGEQAIKVDGKTYEVALRFKQAQKPYSLELLEFRFDRYIGTNTPKNFSSRVRLRDSETGEDREVVISMNDPLRHRGETFYQASWNPETEKGTVLQVVRNPGWLLPYFSCVIVALGMMIHFGLNLGTFLQKRSSPVPSTKEQGGITGRTS